MEYSSDTRNRAVDFLKGISIIFVLITHYNWNKVQRTLFVFPYLIEMAVPIFMIISGYASSLSFRRSRINSLVEAYKPEVLIRKILRYTVPYMFVVLGQLFDPNIIGSSSSVLDLIKWLLSGTDGPGSYYFPIMIQFVFVFPIVYFIIERMGRKGLLLCFIMNALFELLKWSFEMNDECYRLLIFRYIFFDSRWSIRCKVFFQYYEIDTFDYNWRFFQGITTYGIYTPNIMDNNLFSFCSLDRSNYRIGFKEKRFSILSYRIYWKS